MKLAIIVSGLALGMALLIGALRCRTDRRPLRHPAIPDCPDSDRHWQQIALDMKNRLQEAHRRHGELLHLLIEAEREICLLRAENAVKVHNRDADPATGQHSAFGHLH